MSYPYRVTVTASVSEVVSGGDQHVVRIATTRTLPADEMRKLVAKHAEERGWREEGGKLVKDGGDGERQVMDLESMQVTTSVQTEETISRSEKVEATGDMDYVRNMSVEEAKEALRQRAQGELDKQIAITDAERERARAGLAAQASRKLEATQAARQRELNEIVRDAEADALKVVAPSLGTVVDTSVVMGGATGEEYELTIQIVADR